MKNLNIHCGKKGEKKNFKSISLKIINFGITRYLFYCNKILFLYYVFLLFSFQCIFQYIFFK